MSSYDIRRVEHEISGLRREIRSIRHEMEMAEIKRCHEKQMASLNRTGFALLSLAMIVLALVFFTTFTSLRAESLNDDKYEASHALYEHGGE